MSTRSVHRRRSDHQAASLPIFEVPPTLWAYALVRSLAFAAPAWSDGGRIGLGALVSMVLFVLVLRRSHRAWQVLVFLDAVSLPMLLVAWMGVDGAALSVPLLAAAALALLVLGPTRRYVGSQRTSNG